MDDILVSIILPVYNDELYVIKMLESIRHQTLDSNYYEVIVINDGSTDETLTFCEEYLSKRNIQNYRLLSNKQNKGVSYSRNLGIDLAQGKYLVFVDGDDLLAKDYLSKMLIAINSPNVDLVNCLKTSKIKYLGMRKQQNFKKSSKDMYQKMFSNTEIYTGYVTNKLFKSNIIKKNNLLFNTNISYWEDMLFVESYLALCNKEVYFINKYLYFYRFNNNSVSNVASNLIKAKTIYSKARVCQILLKSSDNLELRQKCLDFYANYLLEYKCLYLNKIISKEQFLFLNKQLKLSFFEIVKRSSFKKKIKVIYYMIFRGL